MIPRNFQPAGLPQVGRLFATTKSISASSKEPNDLERALQRHTAAALCHSFEQGVLSPAGYANSLLTPAERIAFKAVATREDQARSRYNEGVAKRNKAAEGQTEQTAPSGPPCHYCQILYGARYPKLPPIDVLNHDAQIQSDFDPNGLNSSTATITNFKMVVPAPMAAEIAVAAEIIP